jgi:phenylpropionate dioxygenase-like ring-hydroxylating dioxygenase large terminal subunit
MNTKQPLNQQGRDAYSGSIKNFSKARYISADWHAREWHAIWAKSWIAAVHVSDLAGPGDYVVFDIGPESLLLTCNGEGAVQAFYNVCQHRGVRLVNDHAGNTEHFRCPYHSWRYGTDGDLIYAPHQEGFQEGLPIGSICLPKVRCEEALGFYWINLDHEAEPLDDFLKDMIPIMAHYEFENLTLVQDQTVSINCNWKAVLDNFSELYHVHYLHPQHRRFVDCTESLSECYEGGHTRVWVPGAKTDSLFSTPDKPTDLLTMQLEAFGLDPAQYEGKVDEIQAAIRVAKRALEDKEPYYGNFSDEELTDVIQTNVFPNAILTYQPEMLWLMRLRPHATDPNQCYLDKLSFERFPRNTAQRLPENAGNLEGQPTENIGKNGRPERESFDYSDVISGQATMTDTIDQDLSLLAQAQKGMHSAGFQGSRLNELECRVSHFHEQLDTLINQFAD